MENTVKFDPGIGEFVEDSNTYINNVYSNIINLYSPKQKSAKFKLYVSKIYNILLNNISFYQGCLLWAYYIKKSNNNSPKEITGNPFLNYAKEQLAEYDFLMQVNFLENYFDSFERDSAYYCGKKMIIPDEWKKILALYSDFLQLNNGFVSTKSTSDLVLPKSIDGLNLDLNQIKELFNNVLKQRDLSLFLNVKIVI